MRMLISSLFVLLGLVLLFFGGEGLVRGSSSLALRLGLTPLLVGLTVVAFGTSAPELVVSVNAALDNRGDIALGNVIGSNILNIGLILGITALIFPLKVQLQILKADLPIMIGVSLLPLLMLRDKMVDRGEGTFLVAGLILYVWLTIVLARSVKTSVKVEEEFKEAVPAPRGGIWKDIAFIACGLALLAGGSHFLVDGAANLARIYGVSEAIIGLTVVAVGTSMPELMAGIVAALKKEPDIALGNIIGSCIFNILGILGAAAMTRPIVGAGIKSSDLYVAIGFAAVLGPMLWTGRTLSRREAAFLLFAYVAYVVAIWPK